MMSSKIPERRPRGRPRGFDETEALDAAMRLFWAAGYEGASIDALTAAMGMPRASLYQHYGDKEALFLAAIEHYARTRLAPLVGALDGGGTLSADLGAFLEAAVRHATRDPGHLGCLIACVLSEVAGTQDRMRQELAARFAAVEGAIAARLAVAQAAGELGAGADVPALAGVLSAVARGIMLSARAGVPPEVLRRTAQAARGLVAPGPGERDTPSAGVI
jgi:TetR/AcrR family transcriptional repressor of nem operon